jgi:hypothetical protein
MEATELNLESGTYPIPKLTFVKEIRLPKKNRGPGRCQSTAASTAGGGGRPILSLQNGLS